jgi:transposase InsO family protein
MAIGRAATAASASAPTCRELRPRPIPATGANFLWAYDFVFDACANGQSLKCLTIIDKFTRECLAISRREAKVIIEIWRRHYNAVRPHSSLDYRTALEFRQHHEFTNQGAIPK